MLETTLCYLKENDRLLMLHRVKKEHDVNEGKWIGIGGKLEEGENPQQCMLREFKEETGLTLTSWQYRGIVNFQSDDWKERMYLFTADAFEGSLSENCDEGDLCWVESGRIKDLSLWEGDRVFLSLLEQDEPLFLLDLHYSGENLIRAVLNGHELTLSRASVPV